MAGAAAAEPAAVDGSLAGAAAAGAAGADSMASAADVAGGAAMAGGVVAVVGVTTAGAVLSVGDASRRAASVRYTKPAPFKTTNTIVIASIRMTVDPN